MGNKPYAAMLGGTALRASLVFSMHCTASSRRKLLPQHLTLPSHHTNIPSLQGTRSHHVQSPILRLTPKDTVLNLIPAQQKPVHIVQSFPPYPLASSSNLGLGALLSLDHALGPTIRRKMMPRMMPKHMGYYGYAAMAIS